MDNQTPEFWLTGVTRSDSGTGLFAVQATAAPSDFSHADWSHIVSSAAYGPVAKVLIGGIGYLECIQRGLAQEVVAFKWIPDSLADIESIKAAAGKCGRALCVRRCAGYGCLCIGGECR